MVYLDSAATTRPKFFAKDYAQYWMNPNSPHQGGLRTNQALTQAKDRIKQALGVSSGVVLFCRCATEGVGWLCRHFRGMDYTTCSFVEHNSVYDICDSKVYAEEILDKGWVYSSPIYFHQHTNPITGTVFDIESIGKQVQSTGAFFGSDITASLGHYPLLANLDTFCDAVWLSGRKLHCETMGAIWLSDRLFKYLSGDESHMITGTPNVPGALALADAVEYVIDGLEDGNDEHWRSLLGYLEIKLLGNRIDYDIVAKDQPKTYAINAIHLPGLNGDALVQYLSTKSIYISPGHSACANNSDTRILEAFGLTKQEASQTVRVSFDEDTTQEHIDALVKGIVEFKEMFV